MGTNYDLHYHFCPRCKRKDAIHLGKSSAGWKFSLQYNGGKYYKNWKEMKEFLAKVEGKIISEYGEEITLNEFIKLVEDKQKEARTHIFSDKVIIDNKGYEFCDYEFS